MTFIEALTYEMRCASWYHLLKPATLLKLTLLHGCFSRFLNCTSGTKPRNAPQMTVWISIYDSEQNVFRLSRIYTMRSKLLVKRLHQSMAG